MEYFFLTCFILVSLIHLYASYRRNIKLRTYTKGFILLSLLGWYCFYTQKISFILIAAILTSWLGDVLLIPKGMKWFTAGGISFMASHVCFILAYNQQVDFSVIPVVAIILSGTAYTVATAKIFRRLKPYLHKMLFYPMFFYLLINGTMNCFALYRLLSVPCSGSAVTFIGATLFFVSDATLFFVRFSKKSFFKTHFVVMLTYILAEFLIVLGLSM